MKYLGSLLAFYFLVVVLLCSCSHTTNPSAPVDTTKDTTHIDTTKPAAPYDSMLIADYNGSYIYDTNFSSGILTGTISDQSLTEASGIAASRQYPNMLWTHNDSGNPNDIFLIDSTGTIRGRWFVTNSTNRDWEDICIGPGPMPGVNYIYLGDIGDNNNNHTYSYIYRFPEPKDSIGSSAFTGNVTAEKITYKYSDGPKNTETLMIDPATLDLYVATKETYAEVFRLRYPQSTDTTMLLYPCDRLPITKLTGGDISPDGTEILMRTNSQVYYWKRNTGETFAQAFLRQPLLAPTLPEPQGEDICWTPNANAYWTSSEFGNGSSAPVHKFYRK